MSERTVSAIHEAIGPPHGDREKVAAHIQLDRLSVWVFGDVARARELAERIVEMGDYVFKPHEFAEVGAEIVSLLTPKESE